jgi:hypothetical protein
MIVFRYTEKENIVEVNDYQFIQVLSDVSFIRLWGWRINQSK